MLLFQLYLRDCGACRIYHWSARASRVIQIHTHSEPCSFTSKLRTIWNASDESRLEASTLSTVNGGVLVTSSTCERGKLKARMGAIRTQQMRKRRNLAHLIYLETERYQGRSELSSIGHSIDAPLRQV